MSAICEQVGYESSFSKKLEDFLSTLIVDNTRVIDRLDTVGKDSSVRKRIPLLEEALKAEVRISIFSGISEKLKLTESVESALLHGFVSVQDRMSNYAKPNNKTFKMEEEEVLKEIADLLLGIAREYSLILR